MYFQRSEDQLLMGSNPTSTPGNSIPLASSGVYRSPSIEDSLSPDLQQRLVQAQIRQTKKKVAVSFHCDNYDFDSAEDLLKTLIGVDVELQDKYSILNVQDLLVSNLKSKIPLPNITSCFRVLIKFGQNLLRPESSRPTHWRQVMLSGENFVPLWADVKGSARILKSYGYSVERDWGLEFPEGQQPNHEHISLLSTELLLLTLELEFFHQKKHPCALQFLNLLKKAQSLPAEAEFLYLQSVPHSPFTPSMHDRPKFSTSPSYPIGVLNSQVSQMSIVQSHEAFRQVDTNIAKIHATESKPCTNIQLTIPQPKKISESRQLSSSQEVKPASSLLEESAMLPKALGPTLSISDTAELTGQLSYVAEEEAQNRSPIIEFAAKFASQVYNAASPWLLSKVEKPVEIEDGKVQSFLNNVEVEHEEKLPAITDDLQEFHDARVR